MKNNFSCPDDLPPVLFKTLKHILVFPLTVLFNQLLSVAAVPQDWRNAVIIPDLCLRKALQDLLLTIDQFLSPV